MTLQVYEEADWLEDVKDKSDSERSLIVAETTLKMFNLFCEHTNCKKEDKIKEYQILVKEDDIQSVCQDLSRFVKFLNTDHSEHKSKKKSPKTIKIYFGFLKSYLRKCHRVKLTSEDIKDYVTFPKVRKVQPKAMSRKILKTLFFNASPIRRALYCVLVSSGMRVGEALAMRKKDFRLDERPVRVIIEAEITKTKEGRETYISSEAFEYLKEIIQGKNDNDLVFTDVANNMTAVNNEVQYFIKLRKRIAGKAFMEKGKTHEMLERYPNSPRHIVHLHSMRAFFHTRASQKWGVEYANALDGHGAYLKQYYQLEEKDRAKKYDELEPSLLIDSYKPESEKTKDRIIQEMQERMDKMQDQMDCIKVMEKALPIF